MLRAKLEGQIPETLRALADSVAGGMDLRSAFEVVASLGLRPMADVARRILALTAVGGMTVEEALWQVAEGTGSANFKRFALIVAEAARSGAKLSEVLGTAARTFATVIEFRRDVESQLRPYVALYYALIVTFVVLADVLVYFLLPQLAQLASRVSGPGITPAVINREDAIVVLYFSALAQALIGGLIIGRIVYFSPSAGLVHAGIASGAAGLALLLPLWARF